MVASNYIIYIYKKTDIIYTYEKNIYTYILYIHWKHVYAYLNAIILFRMLLYIFTYFEYTMTNRLNTEKSPLPISSCGNCSKPEGAEVKLKVCSECKIMKYCGKDCQIAHRHQHKHDCKKLAAELHDNALFKQPPKQEDCPICFLQIPHSETYFSCCGKMTCIACAMTHDQSCQLGGCCPFCRAKMSGNVDKMIEKRVSAGDAYAMYALGMENLQTVKASGSMKDTITAAVKVLHCSADLGCERAYGKLADLYFKGDLVAEDKRKAILYYEKAAMGGDVESRYRLGILDLKAMRPDRCIRHWLIGASCGDIRCVNNIKIARLLGFATNDQYAQAIEKYHIYLDEVKSDQRDAFARIDDDEYGYLISDPRTVAEQVICITCADHWFW